MGTVIHFKGALPEIPFPCADTDNTAFPVMVVTAEKGKERILSSVSRGTCQGSLSQPAVFPHCPESEMQPLPVSLPGPVYPVKEPCNPRNQGQWRKITEIERGIQGGGHKYMRTTRDTYCIEGSQRLPYYKHRPQFVDPRGDLSPCDIRIKAVSPHDDIQSVQLSLQD